jgi:hypothetical protein
MHIQELIELYGMDKHVAQEVVSSHTPKEMETILTFLANYKGLMKLI